MIITVNGKILDASIEHEILIAPPGFEVQLDYEDLSSEVLHNVTEVHWRYPSPIARPQVAFESNVHSTGLTKYIDLIKEVRVYIETKLHDSF